jgi:hypothetical protein
VLILGNLRRPRRVRDPSFRVTPVSAPKHIVYHYLPDMYHYLPDLVDLDGKPKRPSG